MYLKIVLFFLLSIASLSLKADNEKLKLSQADSLFELKKYNLALRAYKRVYFIEQKFTPQMLLRMAQIAERNGNYADALFYLQTLYVHHPSRSLSQYMAKLAANHDLKGFTFSDFEFISIYLRHYQERIVLGLIISGFLLLALMAYRKFSRKRLIYYPTLFVLFCLVSAVIVNLSEYYQKGIVASNNSLVFSGPSAAARLIGSIDRGNRVTVLSQQDIWYHITFEETDGYINGKNLLLPL